MIPNQILFSVSNNGIRQCFNVTIIDDNSSEGTENFLLTFDTPLNIEAEEVVTLCPRMLAVEIIDNDEGNRLNCTNLYYYIIYIIIYAQLCIGSSAGKVNAGLLIIFVAVLGWFFNHAYYV